MPNAMMRVLNAICSRFGSFLRNSFKKNMAEAPRGVAALFGINKKKFHKVKKLWWLLVNHRFYFETHSLKFFKSGGIYRKREGQNSLVRWVLTINNRYAIFSIDRCEYHNNRFFLRRR